MLFIKIMNKSALLLEKFRKLPFGLWIFSRALCLKAPYFGSIHPTFTRLEPGYGEAYFKKRRSVQNHIGTVHAIAMANLCELVAGTTLEITLPATHRWIPKSMKIDYLAKATSDVSARTQIKLGRLNDSGTSLVVVVGVFDKVGLEVVSAQIEMWITKRNQQG
jgi:acyl-coenzyme A thioesterase PaaI-like protein